MDEFKTKWRKLCGIQAEAAKVIDAGVSTLDIGEAARVAGAKLVMAEGLPRAAHALFEAARPALVAEIQASDRARREAALRAANELPRVELALVQLVCEAESCSIDSARILVEQVSNPTLIWKGRPKPGFSACPELARFLALRQTVAAADATGRPYPKPIPPLASLLQNENGWPACVEYAGKLGLEG